MMNSTNPADFEAYLWQFPTGVFRALAQNRLTALRSPGGAAPGVGTGCWRPRVAGAWSPVGRGFRPLRAAAPVDGFGSFAFSNHPIIPFMGPSHRTAPDRSGS